MKLKNYSKQEVSWGLALIFVLIVFLSALIVKIQHNCFHATDFSIYQEAIFKIAYFGDLNPFVNMRNVQIFNDHFDPIIFVAALFVKVFGYHAENLLIFEYLWYLGILVCIWNFKWLTTQQKLIFCTMTIFTKGILSGLNFPIHPTTWSLLPCFLLPYVLKTNRTALIISMSMFICLFKESFPFATLMLGVYYLFQKDFKKGAPLFLLSVLFLLFNFKLRSSLLGPTIGYGSGMLKPLIEAPFSSAIRIITTLDYKAFFKVYYPFIIPLFFFFRGFKNLKEIFDKPEVAGTLFFMAPLFALQILANKVHFHYGAQLTTPLLGMIILSPQFLNQKRWIPIVSVLLFIGSGIGSHTKNFRAVFAPKQRFCEISETKQKSNHQMRKIVAKVPVDYKILGTGGVIPKIFTPQGQFFQAGYFSPKFPTYDLIILERNGSGKTMPLTKEFIEDLIPKCRQNSQNVLMDDKYFFIAEKPNEKCILPIHPLWIGG